jgi:hypothetical protein
VFEELQNSKSELARYVHAVKSSVVEPLEKAGLDTDNLGMYLQMTRIAGGDRSEVANPRGFTPEDAQFMLRSMKSEMTAPQWTALEKSAQAHRDEFWNLIDAAHTSGLISHSAFAEIEKNKGTYATFAILDHLEDHIGAKLYKQVGTFKATANPFANMLMKAQSLIRATAYNDARDAATKFHTMFEPATITHYPPKKGPFGRMIDPPPAPTGKEYITVMRGGLAASLTLSMRTTPKRFSLTTWGCCVASRRSWAIRRTRCSTRSTFRGTSRGRG